MGRFLREELNQVGCDTSHLITDNERLTALVLLGIKDRDTFPLIFYRDNCTDMAITADDFSEEYIASSHCLAITGTHLSHPRTREAVLTVLKHVRQVTEATLVCKRSTQGCSVFPRLILDSMASGINVSGVRVEVLNVLGTGDAFMSGFLRGYLNDECWERACRYANVCGALVVSRHGDAQ